ncbi:phytanoyl-CoA dioxygenase family protein [Flavicella sediminum]|uniref:phytanoyl-CoA dioxygenase family protein n=1 Tax=Flavicella sediminum TaxID=2585141 RepID=UPI001408C966|nr:phytanoyl-CoA dioxygenase family protein [Flavicella sediminum]
MYKKYGLRKRYYSSVSASDFEGLEEEVNTYDLKNSREALASSEKFQQLDKKIQQELLSWSDDGYVVLKNYFSSDEVASFNEKIDELLASKKVKFENGNKIMFAIHKSKLLFQIGAHKKIISILETLLDKEVTLFQSINFLTGSQQGAHSDSISMSTFPKGNLIAIWVALEDIDAESGPLYYYKGSHKLPYFMNKDYDNEGSTFFLGNKGYDAYLKNIQNLLDDNKLEKKHFLAKKGDVLIWHANLVHGGEKVLDDNKTRKSMVFHYYAKDAVAFHEITQRPTLKENFEGLFDSIKE